MTSIEKNRVPLLKDVEARLRRKTDWSISGQMIREIGTISQALTFWLARTLDVEGWEPETLYRKSMSWVEAVKRLDLDGITHVCDTMRDFLTHYDEEFLFIQEFPFQVRGQLTYSTFKQLMRSRGVSDEELAFICQFRVDIEEFLSSISAGSFYRLNSIFCYPMRLNLPRPDLEKLLLEDYIARDKALNVVPSEFLDQVHSLVMEWLKDFSFEPLHPHHGPGAVATRTGREVSSKYTDLGGDTLLFEFVRSTGANPWAWYLDTPSQLDRTADLVFVPKSLKTLRAINKEPAGLMYWQQAVKDQLYAYIDRHPVLGRICILDDSSVNAQWALDASRTREFATVDLSAASDSVSWDLVEYLFAGTPIFPALGALRSESVKTAAGVYRQRKYAPMGSALCFPIECIVFAAITAATVQAATATPLHRLIKVYGDDIILPTYFYKSVCNRLMECGFTVNTTKSFGGSGYFRESCGVEAYRGVDITPLRIPRRFAAWDDRSRKPGVHLARLQEAHERCLEDMANAFGPYTYGRAYAVSLMDKRWHVFSDTDYGIRSPQPTNYHLPVSPKSVDWQTRYVEVKRASTIRVRDDRLAYFHWFVSFGDDDGPLERPRVAQCGKERYRVSTAIRRG